ncbi:MAG: hypothetical protein ACRDNF_04110 [Streptosporangiaceae bacterium]
MDPSSDPGRDEYGLPPVDVQIPDDARDLDRDVQAYHRELKALRRRTRVRRITRPLGRRGMLIPLIAGCVALTLLSGTLLTLIAGHQVTPPRTRIPAAASPSSSPAILDGEDLPDVQVLVDGKQVKLRALIPAVLAWVPQPCTCVAALKQLTQRAARAHVDVYLVGTHQGMTGVSALAKQVGQPPSRVVNDTTNALGLAYKPMGLTAILADSDGKVGVVRDLTAGDPRLVASISSVSSPAAGGSASPSVPASQPAPQAS